MKQRNLKKMLGFVLYMQIYELSWDVLCKYIINVDVLLHQKYRLNLMGLRQQACRRRLFKFVFVKENYLYFGPIFTAVCARGSN